MSFAITYKRADRGSIEACGVGFDYHYDTTNKKLKVTLPKQKEQLFLIEFNKPAAENAVAWIDYFEKACQIKALMYSGNKTINLTEILDMPRLQGILKTARNNADHCILLDSKNHEFFAKQICQEYDFYSLTIEKLSRNENSHEYFLANVTTQYGNSAQVRSGTIPSLLLYLSERIVGDLITAEYGYNSKSYAQSLLAASSTMATISRILNDDFIPEEHIVTEANANSIIDNQL